MWILEWCPHQREYRGPLLSTDIFWTMDKFMAAVPQEWVIVAGQTGMDILTAWECTLCVVPLPADSWLAGSWWKYFSLTGRDVWDPTTLL